MERKERRHHTREFKLEAVRSAAAGDKTKAKVALRIQLVNATRSLNISAGVWKPSVLRGLWLNCLAIALS